MTISFTLLMPLVLASHIMVEPSTMPGWLRTVVGVKEARVHAGLWAALASKGHLIGDHDMLIAATALAMNSKVATFNKEEFRRVPRLSLVSIDRFSS